MNYDYLIVGAGLFGAVFAREATLRGKSCLVIERRSHIGGNCYTSEREGIHVHEYGAHIFHSADRRAWTYIQSFAEFNHFVNSPVAKYKNELYNLPFNMNTFHQMWGVVTPAEAREIIDSQRLRLERPAKNLEEHALGLVGRDIYEKLIRGYTEKQWGKPCDALPPDIMRRIPLRFTYDNNYYDIPYQGVPVGGYTAIFEKLLEGCDVQLNTDFLKEKEVLRRNAKRILFTGNIDSYFAYCFGPLEYRGLRFETKSLVQDNFQGNAVFNYTEKEVPYTRSIEHKHFAFGTQNATIVSYEYPVQWEIGMEPYYPVNDGVNQRLYQKYKTLAESERDVIFGGRLGSYQYYDMGDTIGAALRLADEELGA